MRLATYNGDFLLGAMPTVAFSIFFCVAALFVSCTPNQRIIESSKENSPKEAPPPPQQSKDPFEEELESMRTADFKFIYVYRRKDGGVLDSEDRRFAARTIPPEMNRRSLSDNEKAIIVGSNFRMPEKNQKALAEKFVFQDNSQADSSGREPER